MFKVSSAPHVVQIHTGEINQKSMDSFVEKTPFVKKWQTAEMIQVQVNGYNIFIQNKNKANIIA